MFLLLPGSFLVKHSVFLWQKSTSHVKIILGTMSVFATGAKKDTSCCMCGHFNKRNTVFSCITQNAWPAAFCQFLAMLNCFIPCGHQPGLTSHNGAMLSQTDQRLFIAFIVIDLTCGFVLAPRMCHSLYKIVGFVRVHTATAQMTIEECFAASGHTLCRRVQSVVKTESRYSRVEFVCLAFVH